MRAGLYLAPVFKTHRIDNEVSVYVVFVLMSGNKNLVSGKFTDCPDKLQCDLVRFLCADLLILVEGLNVVLVLHSRILAVQMLRDEHLLLCAVGITVHAGHIAVDHLLLFGDVVDRCCQSFFRRYRLNCCHTSFSSFLSSGSSADISSP